MAEDLKLAPVEAEIMEAIWRMGGSPSVREVLEYAYPNGKKAYTTVQTIMNNLEAKGYLVRQKIGLVNFYSPAKSREEMLAKETKNFLAKFFNGSIAAMANYLINAETITLDEVTSIKKLIAEKEKQLRGR